MKKFKVSIEETLYKEFVVEAETKEDADRIIRNLYKNEEIILNENDYSATTFNTEESEETDENLTENLGYTYNNYGLWDLGLKKLSEEEMKETISEARFELIEKNGKLKVIDLEGANLGDIENEEFDSLEEVLKRLKTYFKN